MKRLIRPLDLHVSADITKGELMRRQFETYIRGAVTIILLYAIFTMVMHPRGTLNLFTNGSAVDSIHINKSFELN